MALMPVLHIADTFSHGGTEKTMQILCASLQKRGNYAVHAGAWSSGGSREDWVNAHVARVVSFENNAQRLRSYIETHHIRIVHVHRSSHRMIEVLRALKDIQNISIIETNAFGKITADPIEEIVDVRAFVSAFCADRFMRAHQQNDMNAFAQKNVVLYNPIDPNDFPEYPTEYLEAFRRSLGLRAEERVLSRVGRADDKKFGDLCVLMLPHLLKTQPHVRLILQSAPKRIERLARRLGVTDHVLILPETADTNALGMLYAITDVAVHASLVGESFGCSLAESMLYRKPVVVNTTPYFDNAQIEVVDNARTGYVVDNPHSFAQAVDRLFRDSTERVQFGQRGYQKVMQHYSVDRVAEILETIYTRVLSGASLGDLFPRELVQSLPERERLIFEPRPMVYAYYRLRNILQKKYFALRSKLF